MVILGCGEQQTRHTLRSANNRPSIHPLSHPHHAATPTKYSALARELPSAPALCSGRPTVGG